MFVEVRDNGAGIEKSRLSSLLTENEGSMGLLNIHNRLIKLYGEGLEIKSEFGYGTTVSFKILKGIKQND
jgi:sensor histidine kinase YesM